MPTPRGGGVATGDGGRNRSAPEQQRQDNSNYFLLSGPQAKHNKLFRKHTDSSEEDNNKYYEEEEEEEYYRQTAQTGEKSEDKGDHRTELHDAILQRTSHRNHHQDLAGKHLGGEGRHLRLHDEGTAKVESIIRAEHGVSDAAEPKSSDRTHYGRQHLVSEDQGNTKIGKEGLPPDSQEEGYHIEPGRCEDRLQGMPETIEKSLQVGALAGSQDRGHGIGDSCLLRPQVVEGEFGPSKICRGIGPHLCSGEPKVGKDVGLGNGCPSACSGTTSLVRAGSGCIPATFSGQASSDPPYSNQPEVSCGGITRNGEGGHPTSVKPPALPICWSTTFIHDQIMSIPDVPTPENKKVKSEGGIHEAYDYWAYLVEGVKVKVEEKDRAVNPLVHGAGTGQAHSRPNSLIHENRKPLIHGEEFPLIHGEESPLIHGEVPKLHIPTMAGRLKAKKLLGPAWKKSSYRKWTGIHDSSQNPQKRQHSVHSFAPHIEALCAAGVMAETKRAGFPMKPFLLLEAKAKGLRYRIITDVPELNTQIKGKVPARLPNVTGNYHTILRANYVVSADFSCFFFQLALAKRRGTPYTFRVKGKLYRWMVVPMGVAWAVRAAQEIAAEFAEKIKGLVNTVWDLTYVDNIYLGVMTEDEAKAAIKTIEMLAQRYKANISAEYFSTGEILGVTVSLTQKNCRVADAYYDRHSDVWSEFKTGEWKVTELLRWVGVLLRAHYILRGKLSDIRPLIVQLAELARHQTTAVAQDTFKADEGWKTAIQQAQEYTKKGTLAQIRVPNTTPTNYICFVDASEWGCGSVHITERRIVVKSHKWATESEWPQVEREARGAEITINEIFEDGSQQATKPRVLLIVDAAAILYAEKKGYSKNPIINRFVAAARKWEVMVAHVRSESNIADTPSRQQEPQELHQMVSGAEALQDALNESKKINSHPRSTW